MVGTTAPAIVTILSFSVKKNCLRSKSIFNHKTSYTTLQRLQMVNGGPHLDLMSVLL